MSTGRGALAATIALAIVAAVPPAAAPATEVHLLVEGPAGTEPLFDGRVDTEPHAVDGGDGSGIHPCWGPPGTERSATPTGALDDAMRAAGIAWRGNWDPSFGDFFVDRIGPYESTPPDRYWSISVSGRRTGGGCLTTLEEGDDVRFRYGSLFGGGGEGGDRDTGGGGGSGGEPGGEDGPGDGGSRPGGPGEGNGRPDRPPLRPRLTARRAHRFLRHSRRSRARGSAWSGLTLAVRRGRGAPRAAAALLGAHPRLALRDALRTADPNATALAVIALRRRRPLPAALAARRLAATQLASGGFGYRPGAPADADSTGLAAWALALSGRRGAALGAARFLLAAQTPGGGIASRPGGEPNAQSTGLALAGLRAAGRSPRLATAARGATAYLASLSQRDGSLAYAPGSTPTPVWTTAQALLGMTSRTLLLFKRPHW